MEHAVPSENFQRETGTNFSEVPHFPELNHVIFNPTGISGISRLSLDEISTESIFATLGRPSRGG